MTKVSQHRAARALISTHRWLGIALAVLFPIWFVSGMIMMYARMPELTPAERVARLYHGLHSLDFPLLYYRRPLWDAVVTVLSLGGMVLSVTTMWAARRRLRRGVRQWGSA